MGCGQSKAAEPGSSAERAENGAGGEAGASEEGKKEDTGFFGGIIDAVQDKVEAVQEKVNGAVGFAMHPYEKFESILEVTVVKTLQWISPKAANKASAAMTEKMPALESMGASDKANETVQEHIMQQKMPILEFCQDVLESLSEGMKPIKALKTCFRKVGVMILRALKGAVSACVQVLFGLAAGCFTVCLFSIDLQGIVTSIFTKLVKMLKAHLKKILKAKAPDFLVDKLPWDWSPDTAVGEEKPKVAQKKEQGIQTTRQKAGKPEFNKKALLVGGLAAGGLAVGGAAGAAYMMSGDGEDEGPDEEGTEGDDWGDEDEEEDDDAYEDFDQEAGADEEADDEEAPAEEPPPEEAPAEEPPPEEAPAEEPQPEEAPAEEPPPEEAPAEEPPAEEPPPEEAPPPEEEAPAEEPPPEEAPPPEEEAPAEEPPPEEEAAPEEEAPPEEEEPPAEEE